VYLYAQRPADFYQKVKPMLNIGGLMQYPRGEGGIVLCNLLFKDAESVPANALKKRNILATILRNLKAPFAGKTVIAGANLKYGPVDISKQANQYRNERGWFGDPNFTFKDLPTGHQIFAGVPFEIYDFPTSPVPTVVMLGGSGIPNNLAEAVKGIPVNRKADALFFLQAAQITGRRDEREIRQGKRYEMARYVITYADGQTETIPIYSEIDVEDFKQEKPQAIPGAQVAWVKPYAGTSYSAVAYMKQWNNPRPNVAIQSVGLEYGPDRRGIPAVLAITAATAE
jgi:beta-galactosidase